MRRRVNVDGGRRHGDEDAVGLAQELLQQHPGNAARGVDDELLRLRGHVHPEAAQLAEFLGRAVGAVDLREARFARLQPVQARPLRVVVHDRGWDAAGGEAARQIDGHRGLARAALAVDHECGVHLLRGLPAPLFLAAFFAAPR
jgi:hypothetical protein